MPVCDGCEVTALLDHVRALLRIAQHTEQWTLVARAETLLTQTASAADFHEEAT